MTKRVLAITGLIVLVALTRFLPHPANFAPMTAMAVFAGIRIADRRLALVIPLVILFLSDLGVQAKYAFGYSSQWGLYEGMWCVYGTTAAIALLASLARGTRSPAIIAGATLAGSCIFYLVTNFGKWAFDNYYPHTLDGFLQCYTMALPFFRNSLLGDFTYAAVLFGAWAFAEARYPALAPVPAKQ